MNIILPDYKILWHNVWPQYECRSVWPIFYGPVILLYMWKTIWHINIILPDYEMVLHNIWPEYECWSVWPMFNGPVILLYIWMTIWHENHTSRLSNGVTRCLTSVWLSHCDLYFMVQWFCPVSERYSTDLFTLSARHNSGELCYHATALVDHVIMMFCHVALKCFDTLNWSVLQIKLISKDIHSGARIFKISWKIRKLWAIQCEKDWWNGRRHFE